MRAAPAPLLVAAFLFSAGCLGGPEATDADVPRGPAALALVDAVPVDPDTPGSEPVVAVAPDGTLYVDGVGSGNHVWRSRDGGRSWEEVSPPATGNASSNDGFVEVGPDGSLYAANVFGLTFQLFRSDDRGDSWLPLPVPRLPLFMHRHWIAAREGGVLHVTVEALEPGAGPALVGGPADLEGRLGSPNQGMYYFRSGDRGATWTTPLRIDPNIVYAGQSNMAVTADGRGLYVVRYEETGRAPLAYTYEGGSFYLLASEDGGDAWERREMFALEGLIGSALTSLAVDAAGGLHYVWSEADNGTSGVRVASSRDGGRAWAASALAVGAGSQAMPFVAAYGADDLALLWYEADAPGLTGDVDASWVARFARVETPAAGPRVVARGDVSGVVHEGSVCVKGPACAAEGGDRRLLDYPWIAVDGEGAAHLAFASTMWGRSGAQPWYARVLPTGG